MIHFPIYSTRLLIKLLGMILRIVDIEGKKGTNKIYLVIWKKIIINIKNLLEIDILNDINSTIQNKPNYKIIKSNNNSNVVLESKLKKIYEKVDLT